MSSEDISMPGTEGRAPLNTVLQAKLIQLAAIIRDTQRDHDNTQFDPEKIAMMAHVPELLARTYKTSTADGLEVIVESYKAFDQELVPPMVTPSPENYARFIWNLNQRLDNKGLEKIDGYINAPTYLEPLDTKNTFPRLEQFEATLADLQPLFGIYYPTQLDAAKDAYGKIVRGELSPELTDRSKINSDYAEQKLISEIVGMYSNDNQIDEIERSIIYTLGDLFGKTEAQMDKYIDAALEYASFMNSIADTIKHDTHVAIPRDGTVKEIPYSQLSAAEKEQYIMGSLVDVESGTSGIHAAKGYKVMREMIKIAYTDGVRSDMETKIIKAFAQDFYMNNGHFIEALLDIHAEYLNEANALNREE